MIYTAPCCRFSRLSSPSRRIKPLSSAIIAEIDRSNHPLQCTNMYIDVLIITLSITVEHYCSVSFISSQAKRGIVQGRETSQAPKTKIQVEQAGQNRRSLRTPGKWDQYCWAAWIQKVQIQITMYRRHEHASKKEVIKSNFGAGNKGLVKMANPDPDFSISLQKPKAINPRNNGSPS